MASLVDWNSIGGKDSSGGKGKTNFMKFEDGKTYVVRPVGQAVEFWKFFVKTPKGNRSVCVDLEAKDEAAARLTAHAGQEVTPQHRFAINVIDREDGKVRILEGGLAIFKSFGLWSKANNAHPGGKEGGDWMIAVEGEGKARRYSPTYMRPAPFSEAELKLIKEKDGVYILKDIYKGVKLEDVVAAAFGDKPRSAPDPESDDVADLPRVTPAGARADDTVLW